VRAGKVDPFYSNGDFNKGIGCVFEAIHFANRYFSDNKPWTLVPKKKSTTPPTPEQQERLETILYTTTEAVRICALMLQPIMPTTMDGILDRLGVSKAERNIDYVVVGKGNAAGTLMGGSAFIPFKIPDINLKELEKDSSQKTEKKKDKV
jgi:methionyl-tRNA synthetase